jgi:hypothetical protein
MLCVFSFGCFKMFSRQFLYGGYRADSLLTRIEKTASCFVLIIRHRRFIDCSVQRVALSSCSNRQWPSWARLVEKESVTVGITSLAPFAVIIILNQLL